MLRFETRVHPTSRTLMVSQFDRGIAVGMAAASGSKVTFDFSSAIRVVSTCL